MRVAVIDSSPLLCLTHLELARKLDQYFDRIYVPTEVQREVNNKHRFRYRLGKLYRFGRLDRCRVVDNTNLRLLKDGGMDPGEAEAVAQAQQRAAPFVIVDDLAAREMVLRMDLTPVGTARLIARLESDGFVSKGQTTLALIEKLKKDLKFRISRQVVEEALRMAGTPIGEESRRS